MAAARAVTLRGGRRMPLAGLGTWKIDRAKAESVVFEAIKTGYRLIDAACDYGNEVEVGKGIRRAIDEGIVTREELFVTSKLWNTFHREEHVRAACERSLSDLGLDYLDLYLIHFPIAQRFVPFEKRYPPEWVFDPEADSPKVELDSVPYMETWQAMETLVEAGLVRDIGACNIGTLMLRDVQTYCKIAPAVLQVELHPQLAQKKLVRFCKESGIAMTAFSSFGGTSYVEIGMADESLLEHADVKDIAAKHDKSPAQVLLRWAVQRDIAVIPKASSAGHLADNLDIFSFELADSDLELLDSLDCGRRFNDPGVFAERAFNTFLPIYE